jgi:hypothetical protein
MKTLKIGIILLALLLVGMTMVPMVSAVGVQNPNAATIKELNAVSLNQSNTQLPQLQYDKTQKKAIVNGEFKVSGSTQSSQIAAKIAASAAPTASDIPFGAIVHHSNDGVTTVFDSTGQQLFAAEDAKAPLINTPDGALPATEVFEVPDKSLIVDNNAVTNVFYDNQRILTVLDGSRGIQKKSAAAQSFYTPQTLSNQWIEYGETAPIATVGQFSAQWNIPKSPSSVYNYTNANTIDGSQSTIWNGLETQNTNFLLQPVLEWYARANPDEPLPTSANWSIATWWVASNEQNGIGIHATRRYGNIYSGETILQGDLIQGNMIHTGAIWDGSTTDMNLGVSSTLFLNSSQSSELTYHNLQAYTVLEGWNQKFAAQNPSNTRYNSSYLPGNTTFTNIVIKDIDGNSVIPSAMAGYVNNYWNYPKYGLSVTNSSWPTSIKLNTGNI